MNKKEIMSGQRKVFPDFDEDSDVMKELEEIDKLLKRDPQFAISIFGFL